MRLHLVAQPPLNPTKHRNRHRTFGSGASTPLFSTLQRWQTESGDAGCPATSAKRHSAGSVPGMTALLVGSATAGVYMHVRAGVAGVSGINDLDAPIITFDDGRPPRGPGRLRSAKDIRPDAANDNSWQLVDSRIGAANWHTVPNAGAPAIRSEGQQCAIDRSFHITTDVASRPGSICLTKSSVSFMLLLG